MKTKLIYLFVFIGFCSSLAAQKISKSQRQEIDAYLADQIKEGAPGVAVGVVSDGEIIYEKYLGLANLEHQVPVDENSRFNVASVAKQFTALATLKLILEGKLSLEDDIRKYLPELYPDIKDDILIRHLLNHSSGIRDFYDLLSVKQDPWWKKVGFDNDDAIEVIKDQKELNFEPGTNDIYSNSNYSLLARIIADISGQSFHEYTRAMFDKLGMNNTNFLKRYMYVIPNQAMPYSDWGNGIWQKYPMVTKLYGDGFLYTTLRDQLTFEKAVQEAREDLLVVSQQPIKNAEITSYGYGLELEDRMGYKAVHHSGGTGAYHAQTVRYPEQNLSIVVMSNNSTLWSGYIADKVASVLLPEDGKVLLDDQLNASDFEDEMMKSSLLGEYMSSSGGIIRITEQDGKLYWKQDNNNPIELTNIDGSLYQWARNNRLKIGFENNRFTVFYPGSEPELHKKLVSFEPSKNYLNDLVGKYRSEELDVTFEVSLMNDFDLMIYQKEIGQVLPLEIIQQDNLLVSDYVIKVNRDEVDKTSDFLITFNRLKNMRFEKIDSETSRMKKYTADGGSIQVGTTSEDYGQGKGDILLTKNSANGNEEWFKSFGGKGYDIASSVELTEDGGYLIVGSTSSYGNGNYDAWVIKVNSNGEEEWNKTFGGQGNEYGYQIQEDSSGINLMTLLKDLQGEKKIVRLEP